MKKNRNWLLSLLSLVALWACTSVQAEPKEWAVTWTDNSDNEVEFVFYQWDETLATPGWVVKAVFPANTQAGSATLDATQGARVALTAKNDAGESGRAETVIDSRYYAIPAMPTLKNVIPFN